MNLGQAAQIVGMRLGVNTSSASTNDGAAVRAFLTTWHNTLWRSYLWKDSIVEFITSANPGTAYQPLANYMPTKNRLILPPIIDKVLGVRMGCRALDVVRPMLFYRADYARFFKRGHTHDFELLSSAVWEFDVAQSLGITNPNAADNNQTAFIDELQADGVTVTRNSYAMSNAGEAIQNTDRIDNFIIPQTQGGCVLGVAGQTTETVNTSAITYGGPSNAATLQGVLTVGTTYTFTAGANEVGGQFVYPTGATNINAVGQQVQFTQTNYGTQVINPTVAGGAAFTGTVTYQEPSYENPIIITLSNTQLNAPKSQRIQLVGTPRGKQADENLYVLGKRTVPTYVADSDVPGVSGFTEILIALAYYDFKKRDEAGGTPDAQQAVNEAVGPTFFSQGIPGGLLKKLISEETEQAAYNTRIIPSHGFGGGYYGYEWATKSDPYDFI